MEMFERTFAMFAPFPRREGQAGAGTAPGPELKEPPAGGSDIGDLKKQMEEMQRRLDRLSDKDKP
jgi:polyhydroxyalkanoate synthesis regulator protein